MTATAPDTSAILAALERAGVRFVFTGSVAAAIHGVEVEPGDLDIAPALDDANLSRLATLLADWAARPQFDPAWPQVTREDCERWTPHPPTAENLDHRFETPHGLFDVVPERSGRYAELAPRSVEAVWAGRPIRVAHPCDLIPTLRLHKRKHAERARRLHELCDRQVAADTSWDPGHGG